MLTDDESFVRSLVDAVPELGPLLAEHIEDFDAILPHVFMGRVTAWAESRSPDDPPLVALLEQLELGYTDGGDDIRGLLTVSFIENLAADGLVAANLPPALCRAMKDMRSDR